LLIRLFSFLISVAAGDLEVSDRRYSRNRQRHGEKIGPTAEKALPFLPPDARLRETRLNYES